ncbi:type 1 glutamine amidotransferase [Mycolicibacterium sp.]|uniref:type 1 glutamine amidotransferase n=1 Tax=Mycolicibacterium sp. TaxID=2320850 RepID=UPI00355CAA69
MGQNGTAQVVVVQPDPHSPLARFETWLGDAGLQFMTLRPFAGDEVPHTLQHDGLIVMGGEMSSLDDAAHPWLVDIRVLLRDAVSRARPTLGICLGGQLLAQAFGGRVAVGDRGVEAGLVWVNGTDQAANDDLFEGLVRPFPAGTLHTDMIAELPQDASWLGSSSLYRHQAFRVGACGWGIQFHPELSPDLYREWEAHYAKTADEPLLRLLRDGSEQLQRMDGEVEPATRELAKRFANIVLTRRQ